jgi:hypothetical protein
MSLKGKALNELTREATTRLNVDIPRSHLKSMKALALKNDTTLADMTRAWVSEKIKE